MKLERLLSNSWYDVLNYHYDFSEGKIVEYETAVGRVEGPICGTDVKRLIECQREKEGWRDEALNIIEEIVRDGDGNIVVRGCLTLKECVGISIKIFYDFDTESAVAVIDEDGRENKVIQIDEGILIYLRKLKEEIYGRE